MPQHTPLTISVLHHFRSYPPQCRCHRTQRRISSAQPILLPRSRYRHSSSKVKQLVNWWLSKPMLFLRTSFSLGNYFGCTYFPTWCYHYETKEEEEKEKRKPNVFSSGVILNNYPLTQSFGERATKSFPHSHHLYQKSLSRSFAIQISVQLRHLQSM